MANNTISPEALQIEFLTVSGQWVKGATIAFSFAHKRFDFRGAPWGVMQHGTFVTPPWALAIHTNAVTATIPSVWSVSGCDWFTIRCGAPLVSRKAHMHSKWSAFMIGEISDTDLETETLQIASKLWFKTGWIAHESWHRQLFLHAMGTARIPHPDVLNTKIWLVRCFTPMPPWRLESRSRTRHYIKCSKTIVYH